MPEFAPIEAEGEFFEVGRQMFAAQPLKNAERPDFQIGEDPMDGGQGDMRRHRPDDMRLMRHVGRAEIGCKPVGLGDGTGRDAAFHEGVRRIGAIIRDCCKPHPPERQLLLLATLDLDGADDEKLAVVTSSLASGGRIILGAKGNRGLIDLDQTAE